MELAHQENLQQVQEDILLIKDKLREHIVKIGFFGSFTNKQFSEINDIDILIMYKGIEYDDFLCKMEAVGLARSFVFQKKNYTTTAPHKKERLPKDFHIIAMPIDHPNKEFLEIHSGKIVYI